MDIPPQRKELEPCGGWHAAAWIFGIFYLFTLNYNFWGKSGVKCMK